MIAMQYKSSSKYFHILCFYKNVFNKGSILMAENLRNTKQQTLEKISIFKYKVTNF